MVAKLSLPFPLKNLALLMRDLNAGETTMLRTGTYSHSASLLTQGGEEETLLRRHKVPKALFQPLSCVQLILRVSSGC